MFHQDKKSEDTHLLETISLAPILFGFLPTFFLAGFLVLTAKWHGKLTLDYENGVQKVHTSPTPRVGGVALIAGAVVSYFFLAEDTQNLWGLLLLSMVPAMAAGLLEDVTGAVKPRWRLLATALGGLVFFLTTGYGIDRLGWGPLNGLENIPILIAIITMFAFAATANATNLVDGFHGLASATIIFMALGLGMIAVQVDDTVIAQLCFLTAGIVSGFFLINYPWGKLFLGDGGAYTLGSLLAALGIALVFRNQDVSPWALLVCFSYPAIETGFSIWRRKKRKKSISQPDGVHFHKLIWRAFARPIARQMGRKDLSNALTLYFIWPLAMLGPLTAALFYHRTLAALAGMTIILIIYLSLYRIVSLQYRIRRKKLSQLSQKNV
jgi:UDP-N-acetylmuramyl pentapeptide phosphotransferase/UDP-N-acetylglucosamine-1-phosphate transferase